MFTFRFGIRSQLCMFVLPARSAQLSRNQSNDFYTYYTYVRLPNMRPAFMLVWVLALINVVRYVCAVPFACMCSSWLAECFLAAHFNCANGNFYAFIYNFYAISSEISKYNLAEIIVELA